jgi:hypothetical protein
MNLVFLKLYIWYQLNDLLNKKYFMFKLKGIRNKWYRIVSILFLAGTLFTCIDTYTPKLEKFKSMVVVDALLTDENISNTITLSRTKQSADSTAERITGATVIIKDDLGESTILSEMTRGIYKTDSLIFRGEIGRSYKLYIKTAEGEEYESKSCLMYPLQDIDSIYYIRDQELVDNETHDGIRIYIDSKGDSECGYYRWTYEEWWKFTVPNPKMYDYVNDSTFLNVVPVKNTCWASNKSREINIEATENKIFNPILFIASDKSDRLLIQYCIQVRQLSLSKEEYDFWDMMNKINESGGDIFDKQPFQIISNIQNINHPSEKVLGYFQVSGAKTQRKYITKSELARFSIPSYQYVCEKIEIGPEDYINPQAPVLVLPTYDQIYSWFSVDKTFIGPVYNPDHTMKLVFVSPICADCTLNGSLTKPDFWVDLE